MTGLKSYLWIYISTYCLLFVFTFDIPFTIFPKINTFLNPFFQNLVYWSGTEIFGLKNTFNTIITSDSIGLYIHVFNLSYVSFILSSLWYLLLNNKGVNLRKYFVIISSYYTALHLLMYGFDKIFKAQFFIPEPNTLFTNLGELTPDLLYWSTIGSSWSYSTFLGLSEVIIACLLLFYRTRLIGTILGIVLMVNVVSVNFSFNISVKIFSCFLLGILILNIIPFATYLYNVLIIKIPANFKREKITLFTKNKFIIKGIKCIVILSFFGESLLPYIKSKNYNDDTSPRPIFHGAYNVNTASKNEILQNWKQVFIHRKGYFIVKNKENIMQTTPMVYGFIIKKMAEN